VGINMAVENTGSAKRQHYWFPRLDALLTRVLRSLCSTSPLAARPQPQHHSELAEERQKFASAAMASRRPPPAGSVVEDVPPFGTYIPTSEKLHAVNNDPELSRATQFLHLYCVSHTICTMRLEIFDHAKLPLIREKFGLIILKRIIYAQVHVCFTRSR
jgi:hypothetical protein